MLIKVFRLFQSQLDKFYYLKKKKNLKSHNCNLKKTKHVKITSAILLYDVFTYNVCVSRIWIFGKNRKSSLSFCFSLNVLEKFAPRDSVER